MDIPEENIGVPVETDPRDQINEQQVRELLERYPGPPLTQRIMVLIFMLLGYVLLFAFLGTALNFAIQIIRFGHYVPVIMGWKWEHMGACTLLIIIARLTVIGFKK